MSKRHFIPGAMDRHGVAHPLAACRGGCHQGHAACSCELANATPARLGSNVLVRPAITVHRISRTRRARRFVRAVWDFLRAPRFIP